MAKENELEEMMNRFESAHRESEDAPLSVSPRSKKAKAPQPHKPSQNDWQRFTFICYPEDIRLMKALSLIGKKPIKESIHEAFQAYIQAWQSENSIDLNIFI